MNDAESSDYQTGSAESLFAFVRFWSQRWGSIPNRRGAAQNQNVLVVQAVVSLSSKKEPTVQDLAVELGSSHAHASRAAARAVADGYLEAMKSTFDGRFKHLSVTGAGLLILRDARAWQEEVYRTMTSDWTSREREEFERLSGRLVAKTAEYEPLWPIGGVQAPRWDAGAV